MKLITILISAIVMNACGGTKEAAVNVNSEAAVKEGTKIELSKMDQDQNIFFEYSAITRGSFKQVKIGDSKISVQKSRTEIEETVDCKKEEWNKLIDLLNNVHLENLSKLEPPSKAHQYDGALAASLTITKDGKLYQTTTFDHGKPPKEIESLVTYILSLSKVE